MGVVMSSLSCIGYKVVKLAVFVGTTYELKYSYIEYLTKDNAGSYDPWLAMVLAALIGVPLYMAKRKHLLRTDLLIFVFILVPVSGMRAYPRARPRRPCPANRRPTLIACRRRAAPSSLTRASLLLTAAPPASVLVNPPAGAPCAARRLLCDRRHLRGFDAGVARWWLVLDHFGGLRTRR